MKTTPSKLGITLAGVLTLFRKARVFLICLLSVSASGSPIVIGGPLVYGNHQYHLLSQSNWTDAQQTAILMGGNLVTINDQAENNFVLSAFGNPNRNLWIGLSDVASEGTFTWVSGEPVAFTSWVVGQPDNAGYSGNEDYVTAHFGEWNDVANDPANVFPNHGVVEVVPEPAAALLACFGFGLLASRRNRKTL